MPPAAAPARVPAGLAVLVADLPPGVLGLWDEAARTVWLRPDLSSAQRRSTLVHELVHAERGDVPCGDPSLDARQERRVEHEAARRLLPLDLLADALRWAPDLREAAAELDVDLDLLRARLDGLSGPERAALRRAAAVRPSAA